MERTKENKLQNKKSLILYLDQLEILDDLEDEEAGKLFKAIANFVYTGEDLQMNKLIKIAYLPIKQSLKRDLEKWRNTLHSRSEAGKKGGRPRKAKKANALLEKQTKAKKAVNVNVNVNVNENVKVNGSVKVNQNYNIDFLENELLKDIFLAWIWYKQENKHDYKTQIGIESKFKELKKLSKNNIDEAKKIVAQSIQEEWKGLFKLKENNINKQECGLFIIEEGETIDV